LIDEVDAFFVPLRRVQKVNLRVFPVARDGQVQVAHFTVVEWRLTLRSGPNASCNGRFVLTDAVLFALHLLPLGIQRKSSG
jgi:hypothetical protein